MTNETAQKAPHHYKNMQDNRAEWFGAVPNNWHIYTLGQLASQVKNKNAELQENNLLSLSHGKIKRKNIETTEGLLPNSFDNYNIIDIGDIVLRLTDLQNDHTSLRVGLATEKGIITSAYITLRPQNIIIPSFMHYVLHTFDIRKGFYSMGTGVRQGLKFEDIQQIKLCIPSLSTQNKIVEYLDNKCFQIDFLISDAKSSIDEHKAWKSSIIYEAVTKGLDPNVEMKDSGIEWIKKIPASWGISKIGALYMQRNEKVSDKNYPPLSVTKRGILPQLTTVAKSENSDNRKLVRAGDFVINSRSDRRGSCGISTNDGSVALINTILTPRQKIHPKYYSWLFSSTRFAAEFYKWGHGIVDDLWTTRWQEMKQIIVPNPPFETQRIIVSYLDAQCSKIDCLIQEKEKLISDLETYKNALIYEVVTGKRKVSTKK